METGDTIYIIHAGSNRVYTAQIEGRDAGGKIFIRYAPIGGLTFLNHSMRVYTDKETAEREAFMLSLKGEL